MKGTNVANMTGDGGVSPTILQGKPKKKVRRVFGRLKGIEALGALWTIEMTKAGLRVRRRCHRSVDVVPFERLVAGGSFELTDGGGHKLRAAILEPGLELRRGSRRKLIPWRVLGNFGQDQPSLFPELEAK